VKPPVGPPWSITDDDDRRQTAKQYWPPYTMCRLWIYVKHWYCLAYTM